MLLSTVVYVLLSTYYESERVAIDLQSDHYDSELFCLILGRLWKHAVATTSGAMRSRGGFKKPKYVQIIVSIGLSVVLKAQ